MRINDKEYKGIAGLLLAIPIVVTVASVFLAVSFVLLSPLIAIILLIIWGLS